MAMLTKLAATVVLATAWVLSVTLVCVAFWAFAINHYDPATQTHYDGFGRELSPSYFPSPTGSELSPGLLWQVIYGVAGIFLFGVCAGLFQLGKKLKADADRLVQNKGLQNQD